MNRPVRHPIDRRSFLTGVAAAAAWPWLGAPRLRAEGSQGEPPLRIAQIGTGGMGHSDLSSIASAPRARIVALCDVDAERLAPAAAAFPDARTFADYRRLLDEMSDDIDAVVVSTPDHMHAPISLAAMALGKHVYCQKPIAHNPRECREMARVAAERGLVTQMGTQIHSHGVYRTAVAWIQQGVIGKVSEAHLWVSRSWAGPKEGRPDRVDPVPQTLDWDLWLGVAPKRPFAAGVYHPARWRGFRDFGCGTLGDMGCHIFDPVFSALQLGAPTRVVSRGPVHTAESFAPDSDIEYEFPATEWTTGPLKFRWTDGNGPSRPDASRGQLPEGVTLPNAGSFLVGEEGVLLIPHWSAPRLFRDGVEMAVDLSTLEDRDHYHEWVAACLGDGSTSTPFAYAGPLTEAVLVGTMAGEFQGRELEWNSRETRFEGL